MEQLYTTNKWNNRETRGPKQLHFFYKIDEEKNEFLVYSNDMKCIYSDTLDYNKRLYSVDDPEKSQLPKRHILQFCMDMRITEPLITLCLGELLGKYIFRSILGLKKKKVRL